MPVTSTRSKSSRTTRSMAPNRVAKPATRSTQKTRKKPVQRVKLPTAKQDGVEVVEEPSVEKSQPDNAISVKESSDSPNALALTGPDAAQLNRNLMLEFQKALEKDPSADLLSIIPKEYTRQHRQAQYGEISWAAKINLRTVNRLYDRLTMDPEIHLLDSAFPSDYRHDFKLAAGSKVTKPVVEPPPPQKFRTDFDIAKTATVVSPLSSRVKALLTRYSDAWDGDEELLATSLKQLIWDSEKIWELSGRIVVKCDDEIAIKIRGHHGDSTEYTNLQYLAEHTPDLPVPRPHGLIKFGPFCAVFMTYIPGTELDNVWPTLSHEQKLSIQNQLDGFFRRLRSLKQDDGIELGGVQGEGAKDCRVEDVVSVKGITTARGFDEYQFSAAHRASPCYSRLLRSFLENENTALRGSVFTHGDLKKSNIMVKQDTSDDCFYEVTGIIDWESSGFYPEYHECTNLSNGQSIEKDDDWYLYAPDIISPLSFPVRWLVDRLWGDLLWNWKTDIIR